MEPPVFVASTLTVSVKIASGLTVRIGSRFPETVAVLMLILSVLDHAPPVPPFRT